MYGLTKMQVFFLKKYGKLLGIKQYKKIWLPHELLIIAYIKSFNKDKFRRYREGGRFISEYHYGFSVGKYSYGYEQFWSKNNLKKNLKSIGAFCSIGRDVMIPDGNHPLDFVSTNPFIFNKGFGFIDENFDISNKFKSQDIHIGNDVWIGQKVILMSGISIGNGSVIGAGSVVTKSVPDYAIAAGIPAKVIRYRFNQEQINYLNKIKWWEWNDEKIKHNVASFKNIDNFLNLQSSLKSN